MSAHTTPAGFRTYEVNQRKLPSVTTILSILRSPSLERWRGDVGNLVADSRMRDGGTRGSNVHTLCEYLARHGTSPPTIPTELRSRYAAFAHFFDAHILKVLEAESVIHCLTPEYAGRCDLIAVLQTGATAAIDIKTSKMITEKMGLQLAAYARGTDHRIDTRLVVQLHANDHHTMTMFPPDYATHTPTKHGYDLYEFLDLPLDLLGFDAATDLFMWASKTGLLDREFAHR